MIVPRFDFNSEIMQGHARGKNVFHKVVCPEPALIFDDAHDLRASYGMFYARPDGGYLPVTWLPPRQGTETFAVVFIFVVIHFTKIRVCAIYNKSKLYKLYCSFKSNELMYPSLILQHSNLMFLIKSRIITRVES